VRGEGDVSIRNRNVRMMMRRIRVILRIFYACG
jgi:hypothetical protein